MKKIISVTLSEDVLATVDKWRERQPVRPSRSALFELALVEWIRVLDRREKRRRAKKA